MHGSGGIKLLGPRIVTFGAVLHADIDGDTDRIDEGLGNALGQVLLDRQSTVGVFIEDNSTQILGWFCGIVCYDDSLGGHRLQSLGGSSKRLL